MFEKNFFEIHGNSFDIRERKYLLIFDLIFWVIIYTCKFILIFVEKEMRFIFHFSALFFYERISFGDRRRSSVGLEKYRHRRAGGGCRCRRCGGHCCVHRHCGLGGGGNDVIIRGLAAAVGDV